MAFSVVYNVINGYMTRYKALEVKNTQDLTTI